MDIRNSLDSLRSLLEPLQLRLLLEVQRTVRPGTSALGADQATLSNAGSEVSLSAGTDGVRAEKWRRCKQPWRRNL